MNADLIFGLGVLGGIVLVLGALWPIKKVKISRNSVKNWLFASGAVLLFIYALLNYLYGTGSLFFTILELLAIVSSILMLSGISEKISTRIIMGLGAGLICWSLFLMKDYSAVVFILGLVGISLGYIFPAATMKRNLALLLGGILIAIFSYLGSAWVFFWLNIFFAGFSLYHVWELRKK
jgi:hypothetical protein